ncbi:MAG: cytochrome C [Sphingomonadales bacterium]|nr:cytochrome C [Sphingomonadales bacterium]
MRQWARLLWMLAILLATPVCAQSIVERLITPGPLSNVHARLESSCDSCHSSFRKEAQNAKCNACHRGVAADIAGGTHFHGRFGPARGGACKSCHSDHKGRGFALIQLNRASFNHAFTDFPLTGAHARATCAGCHGNSHDYRGVPRDCASCHARKDPHRGQLGRACQNCHTTTAWKPIQGFNHASTGFGLTGAHRSLGCLSCHAGQRWKGLGTGCAACHAKDDAHHGSRGSNCAQCHSTASWGSATFDHASTGFPLNGGHAEAACASCHGAGNANKHPARSCFACHARDDVHKGQNGTDCASCHTSRGWKQTSFDHDRMTDFPLKGAHRTAFCEGCHVQPPKVAKPPVTCIGCHAADDKHKGDNGTDCARCHTESAWKSVNFNHDTMTRFPLQGAHARAKCEACHTAPGQKTRLAVECASCHAKDDVHAGKLGRDCARCHSSAAWAGQVRFDHDLGRFPLTGKHRALQCAGCHADKTFASKGVACQDCHADKHHAGTLGSPSQCRSCHNATDWRSWSFDHDKATRFALTGKHQGLICSACHTRAGDPARLGTRCIDCHRRDDSHRGGFGEDCERCHVTSGFREILMNSSR